MSVDYAGLRDAAESLLQTFGSITSLRRTTGHSIDPTTGVVTPGTSQIVDVSLVVLPMDGDTARALDAIGAARAGKRRLVLVCRALMPRAGDELWLEGAWRTIPLLTPLAPDMNTPILYTGAVDL